MRSDVRILHPRDSVNTTAFLLSCASFASTNITKKMILVNLFNKVKVMRGDQ